MPLKIRRDEVKSSMFKSIGYDPVSWTLEIEFLNGAIYRYKKVAPEVHIALGKAESPGRFFGQFIRGKYETETVFKPEREPGDDTETLEFEAPERNEDADPHKP